MKTFEKIKRLLNGFKLSHVLLTAIRLGVFEVLRKNGAPMSAKEVRKAVKTHPSKSLDPLLDVLAAERLLRRTACDENQWVYDVTPASGRLLGGMAPDTIDVDFAAPEADWRIWAHLTHALKTGEALKLEYAGCDDSMDDETKSMTGEALKLEYAGCDDSMDDETEFWYTKYVFMEAYMRISFILLAERFDFSAYQTVVDVGGGTAQLCRILAERHDHLRCTNFDLPLSIPYAKRRMAESGVATSVADRITIAWGNCLVNDIPQPCDVVTMANLLHQLSKEEQQLVIRKIYNALSPGGAFIVIEQDVVDKERSEVPPLLAELEMEIADTPLSPMIREDVLERMCHAVGFSLLEKLPLCGNRVACIVRKPKEGKE